jgi:hypothetical protein
MTTKITALALIAATAVSLTPTPAKAGDKEWALVGGLVGGLIIGSAINESRHSADYPARTTTVIVDGRNDGCDDGYWKEVSVRVWVPGCWVIERSRHGHSYRRYLDGHYEFRTNRVWVSFDRHDHHDREIGYGYGHRR